MKFSTLEIHLALGALLVIVLMSIEEREGRPVDFAQIALWTIVELFVARWFIGLKVGA